MINFLYAECSDIENQTECEAVGCEWTESDNMPGGYCTGEWEDDEEEFEGCSEIDNQEECERVEGCEWSENAGCIEGEWEDDEEEFEGCSEIDNQEECERVEGCEWSENAGCIEGEWEDDEDGGGILEEEEIEGRWHLVGYEDNVMYQFVDTEPFADAGLRYTIYSTDGNFDDLDGDYTGGTPNPYIVVEDIITIDLHFGNEPSYQMNFKCDGQVVELIDIESGLPNSILFRENYDYNDCSSYPNECFDLSSVDFGECEMILGVGWNGYECEYISGCGWIVDGIDYSEYFYDSSFDCQESCWCEDGEFNNDNPCNPMECVNGQWLQIVIDCAEEMGVPCEDGVYISPPADECCSTCVLFGDSNYDGTLNILDITILIGTILYEGQCADWFECPEDVNQDGTLNILDIIELVNIILD
jgi:hypothetical protein